jgi:hypothetical protein
MKIISPRVIPSSSLAGGLGRIRVLEESARMSANPPADPAATIRPWESMARESGREERSDVVDVHAFRGYPLLMTR